LVANGFNHGRMEIVQFVTHTDRFFHKKERTYPIFNNLDA